MKIERSCESSPEEIIMFQKLIAKAKTSYSNPSQSGFHVRAAGITEDGRMVNGGNKENSLSDAFVHGETSVVSEIRNQYGNTPLRAIGFYKEDNPVISPCGACRDVLNQYTSPDLLLVAGNQDKILVKTLRDFNFDNYQPIEIKDLDKKGTSAAIIALDQGVDAFLPKDLKRKMYGVSIVDQNGEKYLGGHYTNSGYDAVTPGLSAVITFTNSNIEKKSDLNRITIASRYSLPDLLYRDRQSFMELADITRLFSGRQTGVQVDLIQLDKFNNIEKAVTTNTDELMPLPFSARSFGMDDAIRDQYNKMFL